MILPQIDMKKTGENIKHLMKEHGYTIRSLSNEFGFYTNQAVCKWVYGKSIPRVDNLIVLSRLFDVSIEEIIILAE